jgi:hypothetical protein
LVKSYLEHAKTNRPDATDFTEFRDTLHRKNLSKSTINNYSFAIKKYHEMWREQIEYPFLKRNDEIPYLFQRRRGSKNLPGSTQHKTPCDAANYLLWLSKGL